MIHPGTVHSPAAHASPAPWRERTLERLVAHLRAVLPVSAVAFVTVESDEPGAEPPAGWFADEDLQVAVEIATRQGAQMLVTRAQENLSALQPST